MTTKKEKKEQAAASVYTVGQLAEVSEKLQIFRKSSKRAVFL